MRGRPTITRANMPTALEKAGNFSQTRITNGTIQPIIDPTTGAAFPGNVIPADRINPLGQRMLNQLTTANGIGNPQAGQEWTSNSTYDLTPVHGRTNHVIRVDAVLSEKTRFNVKALKDRDDDWQQNFFQPGTGFVNQNTPGLLLAGDDDPRCSAHDRQRDEFRVHAQPVGLQGCRRLRLSESVSVDARHRSAEVRAVWRVHGSAGALGLWWRASGRVAVFTTILDQRGQSCRPRRLHDHGKSPDSQVESERPFRLQRRPVHDKRATQSQDGRRRSSSTARPNRVRQTTWGTSTSGTTPTTRSARGTATPTCCSGITPPTRS